MQPITKLEEKLLEDVNGVFLKEMLLKLDAAVSFYKEAQRKPLTVDDYAIFERKRKSCEAAIVALIRIWKYQRILSWRTL